MHGDGPLRFTLGRRPPSGVVAMPLETFPRRPPAWSPTARRFSLWIPSSSSGSARDYTRYHYPNHRPRDAPRPSNTSLTLSLLLSLDVIRPFSLSFSHSLAFHCSVIVCTTLSTFTSPHRTCSLSLILTRVARDAQPDIPRSPLFTGDTLIPRHTTPRSQPLSPPLRSRTHHPTPLLITSNNVVGNLGDHPRSRDPETRGWLLHLSPTCRRVKPCPPKRSSQSA